MNFNAPSQAIRAADTSRVDLLLIAEMVTQGARVLDIGWATARCCASSRKSVASTAAASS